MVEGFLRVLVRELHASLTKDVCGKIKEIRNFQGSAFPLTTI